MKNNLTFTSLYSFFPNISSFLLTRVIKFLLMFEGYKMLYNLSIITDWYINRTKWHHLKTHPGLGRSSGEGNGNPLKYSYLENSMDRGASWATIHGVAKSWTWLSEFTHFTKNTSWIFTSHKNWVIFRCLFLIN